MKKIIIIFLLLNFNFIFSQTISIQPPRDYLTDPFGEIVNGAEKQNILAVINRFMEAVNSQEKSIFDKILYKGINRIVTNVEKDGSVSTLIFDNDSSIARIIGNTGERRFRERYWDAKVITEGNIASVWAPYDFYIDGSFSHCGVDLFYLVKSNRIWKIAHFGYTRNKICE
jgi:hypothetical protein